MQVIQLINHRDRRGAELFAWRLCAELKRIAQPGHSIDVQLVALAEGRGELAVDACLLSGSELSVPRCLLAAARLAVRLASLPADEAVILQANAGRTLWVAVLAARLLRMGGRKVRVVFRQASMASPWLRGRRTVRKIQSFFLNRCQAIASIADACADDLLRIHPGLRPRVQVIPNIVPVSRSVVKPWHERSAVLLMVGAFTREKNHGLALEAVAPLLSERPGLRFMLLGDGPAKSHWEGIAASQPWHDRVSFAGNTSHDIVEELMNESIALILCSCIEGQPGVIVEAMGAGLPVVATAVGGVPELLAEQRGVLVPAGDAAALRAAIVEVVDGTLPNLTAARDYAIRTFCPARVATQFAQLYRELATC